MESAACREVGAEFDFEVVAKRVNFHTCPAQILTQPSGATRWRTATVATKTRARPRATVS